VTDYDVPTRREKNGVTSEDHFHQFNGVEWLNKPSIRTFSRDGTHVGFVDQLELN